MNRTPTPNRAPGLACLPPAEAPRLLRPSWRRLEVDEPLAGGIPTRPGEVGEQRREPQYPAVDRDVIAGDATLGEQLFNLAVRQAVAQVPADGDSDHVWREPEPGERRPGNSRPRLTTLHPTSLHQLSYVLATSVLRTQQRHIEPSTRGQRS
jgi:hypothetical protein